MANPALLGVDVGFSKSKRTTGLAWFLGSTIETILTASSWSERRRSLPRDVQFAIAALHAPIVPADTSEIPVGPFGLGVAGIRAQPVTQKRFLFTGHWEGHGFEVQSE
jgi:hypothetical protein